MTTIIISFFKKTERVASAVFYMLAHIELNDRSKVHYNNLSDKAMALHEAVIASLNLYEYEVREKIYPVQQALVSARFVLPYCVSCSR